MSRNKKSNLQRASSAQAQVEERPQGGVTLRTAQITTGKITTGKITQIQRTAVSTHLLYLALVASSVLGCVYYLYWFVYGISGQWFNPAVTTDDAMQQSYMFHKIWHPDIFAADYITQAMESYLAPVHYWVTYGATWIMGSPIMGGHLVMAIQLGVTALCVFFAALQLASRRGDLPTGAAGNSARLLYGLVPACVSLAWLFHARHIVQRMTGGLPRGWAAPVLCGTICFALYGNHYAVLLVLLIGCLTNPPSTMIAALFYGMVLIWRSFFAAERNKEISVLKSQAVTLRATDDSTKRYRKYLLQLILLSPLYIAITWQVTRPPESIGTMASFTEALANPAFARQGGRFPFIPLLDPLSEIRLEGFFPFISHFERIPQWRIDRVPTIVTSFCALLLLTAVVLRRKLLRAEMLIYFAAVATVYFASRQVPFYLYVPDRHLRLPLGFFFIIALPAALWNLSMNTRRVAKRNILAAVLLFAALGGTIYYGSGLGVHGHLNFNTTAWRKGTLFTWLKENTPEDALIAGHPSHIDDTMLFAMRRAYITAETAHPFFHRYYEEVERRLRITWRAYYARDLQAFYTMLHEEGIDYFVFRRNDFRRHTLAQATYYQPFTAWVQQLASHAPEEYVFSKFPAPPPNTPTEILPFRDRYSIVVDIAALGSYLRVQGALSSPAE